jgi:hypothetical protein
MAILDPLDLSRITDYSVGLDASGRVNINIGVIIKGSRTVSIKNQVRLLAAALEAVQGKAVLIESETNPDLSEEDA